MSDQSGGLDAIAQAIQTRLTAIEDELAGFQALIEERERLALALSDLGYGDAPAPVRHPLGAHSPAVHVRRSSTGSGRAGRGANREAVISFLTQSPGAGAADIVTATGIKRGVAYNLLTRLVAQGQIQRTPGTDGNARYSVA